MGARFDDQPGEGEPAFVPPSQAAPDAVVALGKQQLGEKPPAEPDPQADLGELTIS